MSNQIFCNVNKSLCDKIKEIAGDRIIVDCGAGRGMFASIYNGKVISIDIEQPKEPLSPIINKRAEHYCFPKDSIPIFIRPCHSGFVHDTIFQNRNKFDKAIYISMPKNLETDLETRGLFYTIKEYSDWVGNDGERIYLISLIPNGEQYKYLSGKIIHLADPMLSMASETQEQEFKECIETPLEDRYILVDGKRLRLINHYPEGENFDYMFFDWGGMSMGNSLMESICRQICRDAEMFPSRTYIVVSTFTRYAMKEAKEEFGKSLPNIYTDISQFSSDFLSNKV